VNFFTEWLKKSPTNKKESKHEEQSLETFLSAGKCKCGTNCGCKSNKATPKTPPAKKKPKFD
jgi:hypothetical protein